MNINIASTSSFPETTESMIRDTLRCALLEIQRASIRFVGDGRAQAALATLSLVLGRIEQRLEFVLHNQDVLRRLRDISVEHSGHHYPILYGLVTDMQIVSEYLRNTSPGGSLIHQADANSYITNLDRYGDILRIAWSQSKEERREAERVYQAEALTKLTTFVARINEPSLDDLYRRLDRLCPLQSAFHDSRDAPKPYLPGTLDEVVSHVFNWASGSDTSVFWMCSSDSAKSSAVAQRIATQAREEGRLLATYFFPWTKNDERRDPANLVPTIMYQVALFDEDYLQKVTTAIKTDIDIRHRDIRRQVMVLLKQPFLECKTLPGLPQLIVINALDACNHFAEDAVIRDLCLFIRTLAFLSWRVKVLITSRFTPEMRQLLESSDFPRFTSYTLVHNDGISPAKSFQISIARQEGVLPISINDFGGISNHRQIVYRSRLQANGFFADVQIADVDTIGQCLVKRVPRNRADMWRRLLDEMDEYRNLSFPQIRATLTLPKSKDLLLLFHSTDNEYMNIGYALGIGNNFWPGTGGGFYNDMGGSWRSAERFLKSLEFSITPMMAQTALVSGSGQMLFAFPEFKITPESPDHNASAPHESALAMLNGSQELSEDDVDDRTSESTSAVLQPAKLQIAQVKRRITYLSEQDACPNSDPLRAMRRSALKVVEREQSQVSHEDSEDGVTIISEGSVHDGPGLEYDDEGDHGRGSYLADLYGGENHVDGFGYSGAKGHEHNEEDVDDPEDEDDMYLDTGYDDVDDDGSDSDDDQDYNHDHDHDGDDSSINDDYDDHDHDHDYEN